LGLPLLRNPKFQTVLLLSDFKSQVLIPHALTFDFHAKFMVPDLSWEFDHDQTSMVYSQTSLQTNLLSVLTQIRESKSDKS
jgi:hypothetical protein